MSLSTSTMERKSVLHDINSQHSFEALPLKPNGQRKNTGAHDRIPSDPAISTHESPSGVRRRSLPKHDRPARSMGIGIYRLNSQDSHAPTPPVESMQERPKRGSPAHSCRIHGVATRIVRSRNPDWPSAQIGALQPRSWSRDPGDALQQAEAAALAAHRHLLVATRWSALGADQKSRRPMSSVGAPPCPMKHRRGHLSCPPSWTGLVPPPPPSTAAAAAGSRRSGG